MDSHKRAVNWFQSACILHNFLITLDEKDWDADEDLDMQDRVAASRSNGRALKDLRVNCYWNGW